jgi:plasmid stability protein
VERYTVELRDEAYSALREAAELHGVSVERELTELVERTYGAPKRHVPSFQRLVELGRGLDFDPPSRQKFVVDDPFL